MLASLRSLFVISVVVAVVPFGASETLWLHLSVAVLAVVLITGALTQALPDRSHGRILAISLAMMVSLALYVGAQSVIAAGHPWAHAAWATTAGLRGSAEGAISVAPAATIAAIPQLAQPFLTFAAVLLLFNDDRSAAGLWELLAWCCGAIAVLSIAQFVLSPDYVLWVKREFATNALTGTFVNRNTAATFFGIGALLSLGLVGRALAKMDFRAISAGSLSGRQIANGQGVQLGLSLLLLLALMVALFLTQSRGGIAATFAGLVVAALAIVLGLRKRRAAPLTHVLLSLPVVLGSVAFFVFYAERTVRRIGTQGLEDARWCLNEATLRAISDSPFLGTGFATFEHVFPMYRQPDCLEIGKAVYRAHNSYLEGYLGLGAPFAIVLIVGIAVLLHTFREGYRERRRFRFAPAACLGMAALVMLHSLVDFSLQIPGVAVLFASALGCGAVISLHRPRPVVRL